MIRVFADAVMAGALEKSPGKSTCAFSYAMDATPDQAVSLTMPIRVESYVSPPASLHPIFDMNLPEGYLRNWLAKAVPDCDDFKLLQITGWSQLGRLQYRGESAALPSDLPEVSVNDILAHRGAEDLFQDLLHLYAASSGISGVQPKVLIRDPGRMKLSPDHKLSVKAATHIVKTWDPHYPHLAWNEHFCLTAAEAAGLRVPKWSVSENGRFLVVERFDLTEQGRYLGMEDFTVLAGMTQAKKYTGSYEQIAKTLRLFSVREELAAGLTDLFKLVALNVTIRNGDAHRKNFCLVYASPSQRRGTLAPAFDLVTTTAYLPRDAMALTLDGSKAWPRRKTLLRFAREHCGLQPKQAEIVLDQVLHGVAATRPALREGIGNVDQFAEVGGKMLAAWEAGLGLLGTG